MQLTRKFSYFCIIQHYRIIRITVTLYQDISYFLKFHVISKILILITFTHTI